MDRATYPEVVAHLSICFGRAALLTPPYLVLHCEEFTWPRVSPRVPVRSYIKLPAEPHRFTHHPDSKVRRLVCSLLHLSSPEAISRIQTPRR